ncbi:MAG TPA: magnetic particle specific iron-binding protein [Alphaproteobacteria bacterium]|nr:magnetic particle specific iron-binding protein [Alphaproteobacteria bacterium]
MTPTAQTVAFTPAAPAAAKAAGTTAGVAGNAPAALSKTGTAVAGKSAAVKAAGGGVLWKGTGLGLGLGLGLGAWGPALLLGTAVAGVGVYSYLKRRNADEGDAVEAATA